MGSTRELDAFSFYFERNEHGRFIAHAYQYEPNASTWVMETDPETFVASGLAQMSEDEVARYLEGVFAEALDGHPLKTNRSLWRNFPMIRNERWTHGNIVLIGDAKATAHFSIGSGTKLAMEDAIALADALARHEDVSGALAAFESGRREEVEKTQHSADVSLVWFERLERYWEMDPVQFAFGLMTRAKAITYDNLALRAPAFVEEVTRRFAMETREAGHEVDVDDPVPPMFQPFRLREMTLANRVVVSPMDTYSAVDGVPQDFHLVHYGARAMGGAGLIYTEMVCVSPEGRITKGCAGLYSDAQEAAWRRVVDFIRAHSEAKICIQIGHSGRKGATKLMWEGIDQPLAEGGWETLGPSPLPYFEHSVAPRQMTRADMDAVRDAFVGAAERCVRLGVDMIELHAGHGYLLASFLSPLTNRRTDEYGGSMGEPPRLPRSRFSTRCVPSGRTRSRCRCACPRPTGRKGASPATTRFRSRGRSSPRGRPHRRLDRTDGPGRQADLRAHVPDPVRRAGPRRGERRDPRGGGDHLGRSDQHHPRCGTGGPRGAGTAAPHRAALHPARRRRVRCGGRRLPAAVPGRPRSGLPQRAARTPRADGAEAEGATAAPLSERAATHRCGVGGCAARVKGWLTRARGALRPAPVEAIGDAYRSNCRT